MRQLKEVFGGFAVELPNLVQRFRAFFSPSFSRLEDRTIPHLPFNISRSLVKELGQIASNRLFAQELISLGGILILSKKLAGTYRVQSQVSEQDRHVSPDFKAIFTCLITEV
ncbi:hypothetical protein ES705_46509 [subsurface metagenome]